MCCLLNKLSFERKLIKLLECILVKLQCLTYVDAIDVVETSPPTLTMSSSFHQRYLYCYDTLYMSIEDFEDFENAEFSDELFDPDAFEGKFTRDELAEIHEHYLLTKDEEQEVDYSCLDEEEDFQESPWVNSDLDQGGGTHRARTLMTPTAFKAFNQRRHDTERLLKRRKVLTALKETAKNNVIAKRLFNLPDNQEEFNMTVFRLLAIRYMYDPIQVSFSYINAFSRPDGVKAIMQSAKIPITRASVKATNFALKRFSPQV